MPEPYYDDGRVTVHAGDCLDVLATLPDASVDAVVTDPPYGLEFMGKEWDSFGAARSPSTASRAGAGAVNDSGVTATGYTDGGRRLNRPAFGGKRPMTWRCDGCGKRDQFRNPHGDCAGWTQEVIDPSAPSPLAGFQAWCELWATECLRVLKPGGHLLAFGGTRTSHRLACAIEDAGFEIRDSLAWIHAQGFPKNLNVTKALGDAICRCEMGEWTYGSAESETEHDLRAVLNGNVPPPVPAGTGPGALLLAGMSESGTPTAGRAKLPASEAGRGKPGMEGRSDVEASQGQLQGRSLHPLPGGVPADGSQGRVHHGASPSHGSVDRPDANANGSRQPQGPQPVEQRAGEPGAVSDERGSQAWRGWPVCSRCAKPVVPDGLGTAAKPAHEPIVVARKPLAGTVASNVLQHGTGALNIDGCRVGSGGQLRWESPRGAGQWEGGPFGDAGAVAAGTNTSGRWPANVVLDEDQAAALDQQSGTLTSPAPYVQRTGVNGEVYGLGSLNDKAGKVSTHHGDSGGASRFFYVAKADSAERPRYRKEGAGEGRIIEGASGKIRRCRACGNQTIKPGATSPACGHDDFEFVATKQRGDWVAHPTVKPLALMRWLVRLVTPPGGTVLEPFAGSGTTVEACVLEGFRCIAIEREADYLPLITSRLTQGVLDFGDLT